MSDLSLGAFAGSRCLVTGGLGFIGSAVARTLAGAEARVTVVDALLPRHGGNPHNLEGVDVEVVEADLGHDMVRLPAATADYVFNLAGQVSHLESMANPLADLDVNTRSHLALLEVLRQVNPRATVVFTSTRQVYGRPRYLPVDEDHPVAPVDVNGITKYATEQLHLLYGSVYGLRATVVRLTNVYGPRQRLRGDLQGFLPTFVRRALEGEPICVFGDGSQERDPLFVDDAVDCLLRAALSPDAAGEVFNADGPERLSVRSIAEQIVAATGRGSVECAPWPRDRDEIDIGSYYGNSSKTKRLLGWMPTTRFDVGITETIEFYRAHLRWYL